MRKTTILVAGAALMFASAASAQQQPAPAPAAPAQPAPAAPESQSGVPEIQSVTVVDITELPETTQTQVNELVSQRSEDDLQKLRSSIDATPKVKSALDAKGLSSAQVIAATMGNDGALTLITKKRG
jgi:Spy/CpxP family protein refolding chaperone